MYNGWNPLTLTELSPGGRMLASRSYEEREYIPDELNNHFLSSAYSSASMLPV